MRSVWYIYPRFLSVSLFCIMRVCISGASVQLTCTCGVHLSCLSPVFCHMHAGGRTFLSRYLVTFLILREMDRIPMFFIRQAILHFFLFLACHAQDFPYAVCALMCFTIAIRCELMSFHLSELHFTAPSWPPLLHLFGVPLYFSCPVQCFIGYCGMCAPYTRARLLFQSKRVV